MMREKIAVRIEMADENMFTSYETFADAALRAFAEPDDEAVERIARTMAFEDHGIHNDEWFNEEFISDLGRTNYRITARAVCQAIAGMADQSSSNP